MTSAELLADAFERINGTVHHVLAGLTPEELTLRVDPEANTIAWLVWHLSRVADDHVADVAGTGQVWTSSGWAARFGLPFEDADTGYGHRPEQVSAVPGDGELLQGYHDAVFEAVRRFVVQVGDADLDRIVDVRWTPPVTLGVRLVSVLADGLEHAGQAAYVRGLIERR